MKLSQKKIEECATWVKVNGLVDHGGATIKDFCRAADINWDTYKRWMQKAEFAEAIKKAKEHFVQGLEHDIVQSLAKAAKGYHYTKRKTEYTADKNGNPIIKRQTTEEVDVQPNVGAAVFLLTNIAPKRWQNRIKSDINANVKAEHSGNVDYKLAAIPDELLYEIADKLQDAEAKKIREMRGEEAESED